VVIATAPVVLVVTLAMDYMRIKPASRVHQIALLATRVNVRNVMPIIKLMQLVFVYLVAPLIRSWLSVLENVFLAQIFFRFVDNVMLHTVIVVFQDPLGTTVNV